MGVMWLYKSHARSRTLHKYHECKFLPQNGITIVYSNEFLGDEKQVWNMLIERSAKEEDLEENHYLEEVGIQSGKQF